MTACSTDRCSSRTTRGRERAGEPVLVEPGDRGWFTFTGPFTPEVPAEFSMRITGTLVAPETGEWTFGLVQVGRAQLARSTVTSSSTTGSRRAEAKRSWVSAAPR